MTDKFILDGKTPKPCADLLTWGTWMQTADRIVANTKIGGCRVSTVFLGLNHRFGEGPPLLFQTMVFGGPLKDEMDRYETWEAAEAGHARIVARVKEGLN